MVFYVKISNALFEEKQQLNDQDFKLLREF